jgi:hypothetical protein
VAYGLAHVQPLYLNAHGGLMHNMLGSCAAFVSYLINKARQAGLLSEPRERGPQ